MDENIRGILERNKRVEADKAWEVSMTRRFSIALMTYVTAALFLWLTNQPQFLLLSLLPAVAYIFSTLSLPRIKRWWLRSRRR